jgi:hypothetical protein
MRPNTSARTIRSPLGRRLARRSAGALLFGLFVIANPTYSCPLNCLLHHHAARAEGHHGPVVTGPMCHAGPEVAAPQAPGEELSPAATAAVQLARLTHGPVIGRAFRPAAGSPSRDRTPPPPPPPRA